MSLKNQVKIALIKKGWSQRELARRMNITVSYLQDIWSKLWRKKEREHKANQRIKKDILLAEVTKLKKDIRNLDMTTAKPSDIIELGKRVNYYFNVSDNLGNKEKLKEIFSNFRVMGGVVPKESWTDDTSDIVKKQLEHAFSFYPKEWALIPMNKGKKLKAALDIRGHFTALKNYNAPIIIASTGKRATTPFHEIGHMVEWNNPEILRIEKEWVNSRTIGEDYMRLNEIFPKSNYEDYEVTKKDNFISPYIGKQYINATEVLSMGLQGIFETNEYFAKEYDRKNNRYIRKTIKDDEEFLNFTIGLILKG